MGGGGLPGCFPNCPSSAFYGCIGGDGGYTLSTNINAYNSQPFAFTITARTNTPGRDYACTASSVSNYQITGDNGRGNAGDFGCRGFNLPTNGGSTTVTCGIQTQDIAPDSYTFAWQYYDSNLDDSSQGLNDDPYTSSAGTASNSCGQRVSISGDHPATDSSPASFTLSAPGPACNGENYVPVLTCDGSNYGCSGGSFPNADGSSVNFQCAAVTLPVVSCSLQFNFADGTSASQSYMGTMLPSPARRKREKMARRRARLSKRAKQLQLVQAIPAAVCPNGLTTCPVESSVGYECLDLMTELTSCGRCGRDCSKMRGVKDVECIEGVCAVSTCKKGYESRLSKKGDVVCIRA